MTSSQDNATIFWPSFCYIAGGKWLIIKWVGGYIKVNMYLLALLSKFCTALVSGHVTATESSVKFMMTRNIGGHTAELIQVT